MKGAVVGRRDLDDDPFEQRAETGMRARTRLDMSSIGKDEQARRRVFVAGVRRMGFKGPAENGAGGGARDGVGCMRGARSGRRGRWRGSERRGVVARIGTEGVVWGRSLFLLEEVLDMAAMQGPEPVPQIVDAVQTRPAPAPASMWWG